MIQDLGKKTGPLLLFGGPYSNLHALEAMKVKAEELGIPPTQIICTGDIVGYCAYPEESIQFVKKWGIHTIAGNVEFNLMDEAESCGCNFEEGSRCDSFSKQWFPFAKTKVSLDALKYLETIPEFIRFDFNGKKVFVLHGSYENTSEFIFKSTPASLKASDFILANADMIIAGHSGLPFVDQVILNEKTKTWLNPGVIGMPANDGTPDVWYVILENEKINFHRLTFDYKKASEAMSEHPLPTAYAETLQTGLWDNCDILPAKETAEMGKRIEEKIIKLN